MTINFDAWASGQISSKLWLCEELEKIKFNNLPVIWLLGGWYGQTAFLLLSRNNLHVEHIRSFDLDSEATKIAESVNENWIWKEWKFRAFTRNCNYLDFNSGKEFYSRKPDIVINTSTEHFDSFDWWENIPSGTFVVLQSNNMKHDDHLFHVNSQSEMQSMFPLSELKYSGELNFKYDTWEFTRYMIMGYK